MIFKAVMEAALSMIAKIQTVTLVFVDHTTQEVTTAKAWEMCSTPSIAGRIIDVLTPDTSLQTRYRNRIDNF